MHKTLPVLWYVLGALAILGYIGSAGFGMVSGMGLGAFAQTLPPALLSLVVAIAMGLTYTLLLRVAPDSAVGPVGIIHWALALLGTLGAVAGYVLQTSMINRGAFSEMSMMMAITFSAASLCSLLGWIFFIAAVAVSTSAVSRASPTGQF